MRIQDRMINKKTAHNKPSADNAGVFHRLAFTKPANDIQNTNINQVNPALRLPAGRVCLENILLNRE